MLSVGIWCPEGDCTQLQSLMFFNTLNYHYSSLTFTHVGRVEGYCNLVFCVCEQTFWTTYNIGTSVELPKDLKLHKDQNKRYAFSKTFWL